MGRGISTAFQTALGQTVLYPALFASFHFEDAGEEVVIRFWTGESNISWNGYTWIGGGNFVGVNTSGESSDIKARQMTYTLAGLDRTFYAAALSTDYRNRPAFFYFNLLNEAGDTVTYSYLVEESRMNVLTVEEQDDTINLSLTCESRLIDLFEPRRVFLNNESHRKLFPSDFIMRYVPILPSLKLPWGMEETRTGTSQVGSEGTAVGAINP